MSTDKKSPAQERTDNAVKSLLSAVENQVKTEGKTPEYTFATRVADGVSKNWNAGKIPSEKEIKDEAFSLAGPTSAITAGSLATKATKLMTLACYLSKIDSEKNKLKKDNKDISDDDLEKKLGPLIESLDKGIAERKAKAEAEAKEKSKKKTESTSQ